MKIPNPRDIITHQSSGVRGVVHRVIIGDMSNPPHSQQLKVMVFWADGANMSYALDRFVSAGEGLWTLLRYV